MLPLAESAERCVLDGGPGWPLTARAPDTDRCFRPCLSDPRWGGVLCFRQSKAISVSDGEHSARTCVGLRRIERPGWRGGGRHDDDAETWLLALPACRVSWAGFSCWDSQLVSDSQRTLDPCFGTQMQCGRCVGVGIAAIRRGKAMLSAVCGRSRTSSPSR